jgi:MtN3 and saliva related transmembrane protein
MPLSKETINFVGLCAGTLTTLSFVPQLVATYRSKSAKDISYGYLLAFTSGIVLWLAYGLLLSAPPVILANAVTLVLLAIILILKLRYHQ